MFCVRLGLDPQAPMMVWADQCVFYPHDYVLTRKGRMIRATESRIQNLVDRAIKDTRTALLIAETQQEGVAFRDLVIDTLCREYGFLWIDSASRVILCEEMKAKRPATTTALE